LDVQVYSNVRFSVAFDQKGPGAGRPALRTLNEIGERVSCLIKGFL
jgi:hypothetical protein